MRILIACFPKSGSTYLTSLIGNLPNFIITSFVPEYERREQELSDWNMMPAPTGSDVAQHHVRASTPTTNLLVKHGVMPIVLVRNIYDSLASMADHIAKESPANPSAFFDERIAKLPMKERVAAVADLSASWYISFFVSWSRLSSATVITYEDVVLGGPKRQVQFLQSIGLDVDLQTVEIAAEKVKSIDTRFNVGKSGRGKAAVGPLQKMAIERMAAYYPDVDFSKIGIEKARPGFVGSTKLMLGKMVPSLTR